jgi:hypothetical protein
MLDDAPRASADAEPIDFAAKHSDTFRVLVRPQRFGAVIGAVCGALVAFSRDTSAVPLVAAVLAGGVVAWSIGRLLAYDKCARRECEVRIPAKAARCPRCGAMVQGELKPGDSLQDAMEKLRRRRVDAKRSRAARAR